MISTKLLLKQTEKFIIDNSPAILTAIGVTGTITTAYLTGKASFKASDILNTEVLTASEEFNTSIPFSKKVKAVWKLYIPAASAGALTVASVISANRVSTRRAAAMAAAYSLGEKAFSDYKEKVVEKLGVNKERAARDELAQDNVNRNPLSTKQIIFTGNGEVLCFDQPVARYFKSNMETMRSIVNDINEQALNTGHATLSDFYIALNLPPTPWSEELGWTREELCNVQYSTTLTDDNQPCIVLDYQARPIRGYKHLD